MKGEEGVRIALAGSVDNSSTERAYGVTLIAAGDLAGWNITLPESVLEKAAPLFEGVTVFLDHAESGHPSVRDVVGHIDGTSYSVGRVKGTLHLAPGAPHSDWLAGFLDHFVKRKSSGHKMPNIGLSAVLYLDTKPGPGAGRTATAILDVESCDIVFKPAARGSIDRIAAQVGPEVCMEGTQSAETAQSPSAPVGQNIGVGTAPSPNVPQTPALADTPMHVSPVVQMSAEHLHHIMAGHGQPHNTAPHTHPAGGPALPMAVPAPLAEATGQLVTLSMPQLQAMMREEMARLFAGQVLQNLGVPRTDGAVSAENVQRGSQVRSMMNDMERVELAAKNLLLRDPLPSGVRPLQGIRELYLLMSGDYEMTGMFRGERVTLSGANSASLPNLITNVLNKRLVDVYAGFPHWFEPVVYEDNFNSLQQATWVELGGIADLPTVAEGAAYTELTVGDNKQSASFVKKGGYIGITLEMMDKDDVHSVREIPQRMATSAYRTLSAAIANLITQGSAPNIGQTLSEDSTTLYNAGHANYSTNVLNVANWDTAVQAMFKQAERTSARRLGIRPKYLVVPIELETYARQLLGSPGLPDTANNNINPRLENLENVVTCFELTRAATWYAFADPKIYPTLAVGYRFGKVPEFFTVTDPHVGLMFTNDIMPIKVRFFFATAAIDWRGTYVGYA